MGYQPFLISNFRTGLQLNQQPWLIVDDAQTQIFDGYIRNGVINKRDGYNYYADGGRGGAPYCESRIINSTTITANETPDDNITTFTFDTTAVTDQVRRGGIEVTGSSPAQTISDNGVDGTMSGSDGTIDTAITTSTYTSFPNSIQVTFDNPPATSSSVTLRVDQHPGNPVMMVAEFIASDNDKELIVADTTYLNRYNSTTNRLDDITNRQYTGTFSNFFDWVQYPSILDEPRLIFTNNTDIPQYYNGTTVGDFLASFQDGTPITAEVAGSGDGTTTDFTHTLASTPVVQGSITVTATVAAAPVTMVDNSNGTLSGAAGTGTINYTSGALVLDFSTAPDNMTNITVAYTPSAGYVQRCLHVVNYRDRLLMLRTTENGTVYPQRIRISGLGQSGDDFRTTAIGAGIIDLPDQEWINGWDFNRDDLLIYTNRSTWILKYTGSDIVPFSLSRIENTRGNLAPFGPISYLGYTKAFSPRGFTITDGYQVQRYDEKIPDYSYDNISQENFDLCFSGDVDDEDTHYLIHPSEEATESDVILVHNYEEQNFSVYRIPLSCMGKYIESDGVTWTDLLTLYPDATDPDTDVWKGQFSQDYATWNDLSYTNDQRISIGGGHKGEIWRLNKDEGEDNPQRVRGMTIVSSAPLVLDIVSDWHNYVVGDYVVFGGVEGAEEANNKQARIIQVNSNNSFRVEFYAGNPETIGTYTANTGSVSRSIPFELVTKNFNPFVGADSKVRCGNFYIRADVTGTMLTDAENNVIPAVIEIEMLANDNADNTVQIRSTALNMTGNLTNREGRVSAKRWNKSFPNLTGDFIQFKLSNVQAGTRIRIDAFMLGMAPVGRIL